MATLNATGISLTTVRKYADLAVGYMQAGHTVPQWWMPNITKPHNALGTSIQTVRSARRTDGTFVAHAARVVGFVAAARSLNEAIPLAARRAVVEADHAAFLLLSEDVDPSRLGFGAFTRGVKYTLDQWVAQYDSGAAPVMARQQAALNSVVRYVSATRDAGGNPAVVFDLDGCLFRSGNRQAAILRDVAVAHSHKALPALVHTYISHPASIGYDLMLELSSRDVQDEGFLGDLRSAWKTRFFTDLCSTDDAAPGGPEFVRAVMEVGGLVIYYTGRHETSVTKPDLAGGMKQGTLKAMERAGYPLPDDDRVFLVMKRLWEEDDFTFKEGALGRIDALGTVVAAFDNEPKAVNIFSQRWSPASVFRVSRSRLPNRADCLQGLIPLPSSSVDIADFRR